MRRAQQMGGAAPSTNCLYLENMATANELLDEGERKDIAEDVKVRRRRRCRRCAQSGG